VIKRTEHFGFRQRSAPVESKVRILHWHAGHLFCDGSKKISCFRFGIETGSTSSAGGAGSI
jgi:hypothetical protein